MSTQEHLQRIIDKCRANLSAVMPGQVITPDAEAGWRSTIAAIEYLSGLCSVQGMHSIAWDGLKTIIAAWPEELL